MSSPEPRTAAKPMRLLRDPVGERLDIADHLREVTEDLVAAPALAGKIELEFAADRGILVPTALAMSIGLIVHELVDNSILFAHPAGVAGRIEIECRRASGMITIRLRDDGVGLPEGLDPMHDGHSGFRLVRTLAVQLGATFAFQNDALGLSFVLRVPAA
jgi:two-component sensor histidine kinase